jgi:hypothetical protein
MARAAVSGGGSTAVAVAAGRQHDQEQGDPEQVDRLQHGHRPGQQRRQRAE